MLVCSAGRPGALDPRWIPGFLERCEISELEQLSLCEVGDEEASSKQNETSCVVARVKEGERGRDQDDTRPT